MDLLVSERAVSVSGVLLAKLNVVSDGLELPVSQER